MTTLVSRAPRSASSPCSTFVWIVLFFLLSVQAHAVSCRPSQARRFPETNLPDAGKALDADKVEDAIQIYKKALSTNPSDPTLHAALAEAYLDQGKITDADAEITRAISDHAHSAVLETVLAEVQLQEGRPWDSQDTIGHALADDPCYPDAHLIEGRLLGYISMYGSAAQQFSLAYQLAPNDSDALYQYLATLPAERRIAVTLAFIEREKPDTESETKLRQYIERQRKQAAASPVCTIASSSPTSTDIPLLPLMRNGQHIRAVGLDVKVDQHSTHLEIDTGSGGLILSPSAAARAGLQYESDTELGGIGGNGAVKGHLAFAKSVKIGSLEFHNCPVRIYDRKRLHSIDGEVIEEGDGLIGMDMLQQFLITLDYPHGKLNLAPLPSIPNTLGNPLSLSDDADVSQWSNRYVAPEMTSYALAYRVGHDLVVPTRVANDKDEKVRLFILDTGAYDTMLTTDAARGIRKLQHDKADQVFGLTGAEENLYSVGRVNLEFAHLGLIADGVLAVESKDLGGSPMKISGLIGASALRQCILHLDYRDGLVKLDYTPGPSRFFGVQ